MKIVEVKHPLVKHKLGLMRENDISTKRFRELASEVGSLLTYEATADLETEKVTIEGWNGPVEIDQIKGKKITVVPILRAGLGMMEGVLENVPSARISVVGMYRNEETLEPVPYFQKLVSNIDERMALIVDPMLATGGSVIATIDLLKKAGCSSIKVLVLVAAPEGIAALEKAHPDVELYTASIDQGLNEHGYIIPGLGDAGDKIFEDTNMSLPHCPQCNSEYTYEDNGMFICPECAHEWNDAEPAQESDELIVKDANGNLLADGDSVTIVKDLKVKGSSSMLKIGTKVKNIRLVEGDHNIDCKIDGFGPMKLKSEFVKKN